MDMLFFKVKPPNVVLGKFAAACSSCSLQRKVTCSRHLDFKVLIRSTVLHCARDTQVVGPAALKEFGGHYDQALYVVQLLLQSAEVQSFGYVIQNELNIMFLCKKQTGS